MGNEDEQSQGHEQINWLELNDETNKITHENTENKMLPQESHSTRTNALIKEIGYGPTSLCR